MTATVKADTTPMPQPNDDTPLARLTDGMNIAIYNWARADLPETEWFEITCDDQGRIILTPVDEASYEASLWAEQRDRIAAAARPRPYAHLTVDELRDIEMTQEERDEELFARGIISRNKKKPGELSIKPVARVPGTLERFLKERRGEA